MNKNKCVYCKSRATTEDALGLPACKLHSGEADEYFEQRTGHKPNEDTHLYCDDHCDMWQPGCPRCEENSRHHYGMSVTDFKKTDASKMVVLEADSPEEVIEMLKEQFG